MMRFKHQLIKPLLSSAYCSDLYLTYDLLPRFSNYVIDISSLIPLVGLVVTWGMSCKFSETQNFNILFSFV